MYLCVAVPKYIGVYLSPLLFYVGLILGPYVHVVVCIKFGVGSPISPFSKDFFMICSKSAKLVPVLLFIFYFCL